MWFYNGSGSSFKQKRLIEKAVQTTLTLMDYGWDKNMVVFLFYGCKVSPQQLEWDQKLWWNTYKPYSSS